MRRTTKQPTSRNPLYGTGEPFPFPPPELEPEEVAVEVRSARDIIETDGMPMDSEWQREAMNLLLAIMSWHYRDQPDHYVAGNMFIYYKNETGAKVRLLGPDFFHVAGAKPKPAPFRRYWMTYKENDLFPNVVLELLSPRTRKTDLGFKKKRYERELRIPEYFVYDPEQEWLQGWRLVGRKYASIEHDEQFRLWSEGLGLWLDTWTGTYQGRTAVWPRFFDSDGRMLPTAEEFARQQLEAEKQRANAEKQRADALQRELEALKLSKKRNGRS